jgi:hypothetical protein
VTNEFKITLARIENAGDSSVSITFQIDRAPVRFRVPIVLDERDFDYTEIVEASRNALHNTFVQLADQTHKWKLTTRELKLLSDMNTRQRKRRDKTT